MVRGTTPTLLFKLPFELRLFNVGYVTFVQLAEDESVVSYLDKNIADCVCDGNTIECTLTQEETLSFYPDIPLLMQIRLADTNTQKAIASDIISEHVTDVLKDGIL